MDGSFPGVAGDLEQLIDQLELDRVAVVGLWYGDADTLVPLDMGRHLESVLPDSRLTVLPGEGHMVFITHWAEILRGVTTASA